MPSLNELDFVSLNINKGIRPDLRSFTSKRETLFTRQDNSHSDGSLEVRQGYSHIRINLQFTNDKSITSNYSLPPFDSLPLLELNVGLIINLEVYRDDGNIRDMFNNGLRYLLSNIEIPSLTKNDISSSIYNINLPESSTFAIFKDNQVIRDPSKIEEEGCESLVTVFHNEKEVVSIITYKSGKLINPSEIIKYI